MCDICEKIREMAKTEKSLSKLVAAELDMHRAEGTVTHAQVISGEIFIGAIKMHEEAAERQEMGASNKFLIAGVLGAVLSGIQPHEILQNVVDVMNECVKYRRLIDEEFNMAIAQFETDGETRH